MSPPLPWRVLPPVLLSCHANVSLRGRYCLRGDPLVSRSCSVGGSLLWWAGTRWAIRWPLLLSWNATLGLRAAVPPWRGTARGVRPPRREIPPSASPSDAAECWTWAGTHTWGSITDHGRRQNQLFSLGPPLFLVLHSGPGGVRGGLGSGTPPKTHGGQEGGPNCRRLKPPGPHTYIPLYQ